ncbi:hypothetical protein ACTXT7_000129 [Hymenolepis weldensis]
MKGDQETNKVKGSYRIKTLVMRVSQTFWWFGKFDRFQPFFRFNVKLTLKSDIMEYNDKIILTNTWPSTCVCPDKLVVGKRYLLLTHSNVSRQTLRITTESVFLEKPKKYTRLILLAVNKLVCYAFVKVLDGQMSPTKSERPKTDTKWMELEMADQTTTVRRFERPLPLIRKTFMN